MPLLGNYIIVTPVVAGLAVAKVVRGAKLRIYGYNEIIEFG